MLGLVSLSNVSALGFGPLVYPLQGWSGGSFLLSNHQSKAVAPLVFPSSGVGEVRSGQ